ncbi:MAG: hypothetical protein KDI03_09700, partial [Anaerolineae bacterium]|nr:hypothetical protein [Anaerolineae bacterium]
MTKSKQRLAKSDEQDPGMLLDGDDLDAGIDDSDDGIDQADPARLTRVLADGTVVKLQDDEDSDEDDDEEQEEPEDADAPVPSIPRDEEFELEVEAEASKPVEQFIQEF